MTEPSKFLFMVHDKEADVTCIVGPCTCEDRDELIRLWSGGEVNDNQPFDDSWGFQPVLC